MTHTIKTTCTMPPCSCCNNNTARVVLNDQGHETSLLICAGCGALLGHCYRGDSPVLMTFSPDTTPAEQTYFDLDLLGSGGITRTHGWYNPADMKVVQFG